MPMPIAFIFLQLHRVNTSLLLRHSYCRYMTTTNYGHIAAVVQQQRLYDGL